MRSSRSRSPPSAAREPRDLVRGNQLIWYAAPNGDHLWGEMVLRRHVENGTTVTLRQMKAVVGPKTDAALMKLLARSLSLPDFLKIKFDDAIPISTLAQATGPDGRAATAAWISLHLAQLAQGPAFHAQWGLTLTAFLLHAVGAPRLVCDEERLGGELLNEAGVPGGPPPGPL